MVDRSPAINDIIGMSPSNNDNKRVAEKQSRISYSSSSVCSIGEHRHPTSKAETKRSMCDRRRRRILPIVSASDGLTASPTSVVQQDTSCYSSADTKSTMSNSTCSSSSASSSRIRSRYLHRLGVVGPTTPVPTIPSSTKGSRSPASSQPLKRISRKASTTEALKDGSCGAENHRCSDECSLRGQPHSLSCIKEDPRELDGSFSDQSSFSQEDHPHYDENASTSSHHSVVSFDSTVTVHFIPKRQEYSNRIKSSMWMDPQELQLNAARNVLEFAAENWDWRQATEEKDMVIVDDHTLVHPVHMHRQCNMQRQFLMIMSAHRQF